MLCRVRQAFFEAFRSKTGLVMVALAICAAVPQAAFSQEPVLLPQIGDWTIVSAGSARGGSFIAKVGARVEGSVCAGQALLVGKTLVAGDLVAADPQADPGAVVRASAVLGADVATAAKPVTVRPRGRDLPGTSVSEVPAGASIPRRDGSGVYDATGASPLLPDCTAAREAADAGVGQILALDADRRLGRILVEGGQMLTVVAARPGAVNVLDARRVLLGEKATLVLDGRGDDATVMVLRVARRVLFKLGARLVATGGLAPERVMVAALGRTCRVGDRASGVGSLVCPRGNVLLHEAAQWHGALVGGRGRVIRLGRRATVLAAPFEQP